MWTRSYSKQVQGLSIAQVWKVWSDVNQWHTWQTDIEYAKMAGEIRVGNSFLLKPKGGPKVNIEIIRVDHHQNFTDLTRFPFAKMYGAHELIEHGDALEIKTTMTVTGPLAFIWKTLVATDIVKGLPEQTDNLIAKVRNDKGIAF
ncbi:MAG: polyketide cyclase [Gammaproteobacteria bacterium]|nr:polyketide cyclase [Gammaproteobacteria bacterium]